MRIKTRPIIYVVLVLLLSILYFLTNSSYQKSFQAKFYYALGEYDEALKIAEIAYEQDVYNKMAYTVLMQSKRAIKYSNYIKQGKEFLDKIMQISIKKEVNKADIARINMMVSIMIDEYSSLTPTKLTDDSLQNEAKVIYDKFFKISEQFN